MIGRSNILNRALKNSGRICVFGNTHELDILWQSLIAVTEVRQATSIRTSPTKRIEYVDGSQVTCIDTSIPGSVCGLSADVIYMYDSVSAEYFQNEIQPIWLNGSLTELYKVGNT